MKKIITNLFVGCSLLCSLPAMATNFWHIADAERAPKALQVIHPTKFQVFTVDETSLKLQMWNLTEDPNDGIIVTLPLPDGTYRDFKVWQSSMMPEELAARYPEIKTFTGVAVSDQRVTAKLDFTVYGFHAMIFDGDNTCFVDPYDNFHDGFYMAHYKSDETRAYADRMKCEVMAEDHIALRSGEPVNIGHAARTGARTFNGHNLRTYRLALSADHFYCQAATGLASPTIAQSLSKMTTSMNRINGVYNREFSVQMNFCTKEDTLIWPTNTGSINGNDPFNTIDANGSACMTANQTQCTNRIGSGNYDLGHVFTTGGGGISSLGVVCNNTQKAKSCTGSSTPVGDGFDIDYVAHEMGHEFGANHTFNNNSDGSCSGNGVSSVAYEPGSGSTIMAYAGICPPDDLQPHSDPYFHIASLMDITTKLNGSENACAVITSTGNKLVYLPTFSANYTIPYKTPFELTAPTAVDSVADTLNTYCWDQMNKGSYNTRLANTYASGPIFRSYNPSTSPTRVFPKLSLVLAGTLTYVGTENAQGEKAPDTARYLTFKMTARDIYNGKGCYLFPDDTIHLNVVATGAANNYAGFKVTSQGTTGISYAGGSTQTITWNVVGTSAAPVSATNVVIYMSTDGGYTWPYTIGTFPNSGTASVSIPNVTTTSQARFKVKGSGNVFFNVNMKNFTVTHTGGLSTANLVLADNVNVYPVPATNMLNIVSTANTPLSATVYNVLGQNVWNGTVNDKANIQVADWARGIYYIKFTGNEATGQVVKQIVLE